MSDKIRDALAGMLAIVDESRGVDGYHLSGDIAEWDTFPEVAAARAALAQQPTQVAVPDELRQHILHMRRELTRFDRSPWNVRQRLAQRVTELLAAAPAPAAQEPDTVKVPRELLEYITTMGRLTPESWRKLNALLGKEGA